MGSSDKFCLRWNEFESNMSAAFGAIRDDGDFFDVRLACEDGSKQIPAHRIVLSACSDFFRTVLRGMGSGRISASGQNPVLYLRGVTYTDLEAVLNFMYHGEANVAQNDLNNFLAVAEELCVKGLTGDDQKSAKPAASAKSSPSVSGSSGIKRGPGRPPGPLTKRPKMAVDSGNSGLKVKSEISPVGPAEDDFDEDAEGGGGDYSGTEGFDDSGGGGGGEYGEIDPIAGTSGRGGGSSGVDDSKDPFSNYENDDFLEQHVSISKELEGERRGSRMIVTADNNIYRRTKAGERYLGCYFGNITKPILKMRPDAQRCKATAVMKNNIVQLRVPHNHEPDARFLKRLEARQVLFEAAANSTPGTIKKTFDATLEELDAVESFGSYKSIYRTMKRIQNENENKIFDQEYECENDSDTIETSDDMIKGEDKDPK